MDSRILGVVVERWRCFYFFFFLKQYVRLCSLYFVMFVITMLIDSCGTRFCGRINGG